MRYVEIKTLRKNEGTDLVSSGNLYEDRRGQQQKEATARRWHQPSKGKEEPGFRFREVEEIGCHSALPRVYLSREEGGGNGVRR